MGKISRLAIAARRPRPRAVRNLDRRSGYTGFVNHIITGTEKDMDEAPIAPGKDTIVVIEKGIEFDKSACGWTHVCFDCGLVALNRHSRHKRTYDVGSKNDRGTICRETTGVKYRPRLAA